MCKLKWDSKVITPDDLCRKRTLRIHKENARVTPCNLFDQQVLGVSLIAQYQPELVRTLAQLGHIDLELLDTLVHHLLLGYHLLAGDVDNVYI